MIVLFGHQKGGVGKSTISINFAYTINKQYKDILLLDLDSQNSVKLFNKLRLYNKQNIINCIKENDTEFNILISKYKGKKNNLLIIDSGGYDSEINRKALIKADIIITPVGLSQIEIFGLQIFKNIIKKASLALNKNIKAYIVLNNIDSRSKKALLELKEYINKNNKYFTLLNTILYTRNIYKKSYGEGLIVKELDKKCKATKEIEKLTKDIKYIINSY